MYYFRFGSFLQSPFMLLRNWTDLNWPHFLRHVDKCIPLPFSYSVLNCQLWQASTNLPVPRCPKTATLDRKHWYHPTFKYVRGFLKVNWCVLVAIYIQIWRCLMIPYCWKIWTHKYGFEIYQDLENISLGCWLVLQAYLSFISPVARAGSPDGVAHITPPSF